MSKPLKTQNTPMIIMFLIWCFSLYLLFLYGFEDFWRDIIILMNELRDKKAFMVIIAPLLSFVLSSIINAEAKAVLVFWKIKNPLPGTRAFTEICNKDTRIDIKILKEKIGHIPTDPKQQNYVWYNKIYKKVQENTPVLLAHKNFLLARDLASISFLFFLITPWIIYFVSKDIRYTLLYVLITFLQYIVLSIVAQNHGKRFVGNAIADYCSENIEY
ncbi:MAG: hypothetical protein ACOY9Y_00495 [Bacillota bacterium]